MVSFNYLIENCFNKYNVYIPLIQRNYKWNSETAAKLASDLWNAYKNNQSTYTIGMITFYYEETYNPSDNRRTTAYNNTFYDFEIFRRRSFLFSI